MLCCVARCRVHSAGMKSVSGAPSAQRRDLQIGSVAGTVRWLVRHTSHDGHRKVSCLSIRAGQVQVIWHRAAHLDAMKASRLRATITSCSLHQTLLKWPKAASTNLKNARVGSACGRQQTRRCGRHEAVAFPPFRSNFCSHSSWDEPMAHSALHLQADVTTHNPKVEARSSPSVPRKPTSPLPQVLQTPALSICKTSALLAMPEIGSLDLTPRKQPPLIGVYLISCGITSERAPLKTLLQITGSARLC